MQNEKRTLWKSQRQAIWIESDLLLFSSHSTSHIRIIIIISSESSSLISAWLRRAGDTAQWKELQLQKLSTISFLSASSSSLRLSQAIKQSVQLQNGNMYSPFSHWIDEWMNDGHISAPNTERAEMQEKLTIHRCAGDMMMMLGWWFYYVNQKNVRKVIGNNLTNGITEWIHSFIHRDDNWWMAFLVLWWCFLCGPAEWDDYSLYSCAGRWVHAELFRSSPFWGSEAWEQKGFCSKGLPPAVETSIDHKPLESDACPP